MIRSRVWLLSVVAALLVAGPAMAYSWPLLFGFPAVFGPEVVQDERPLPPPPSFEESDSEFKDLLVQVKGQGGASRCAQPCAYEPLAMPYADERGRCPLWAPECCDQAEAYVAQWRKLWQQGKFGDAYFIARCAVQADPNNRDARHALVVSQIVNENSRQQVCPDLGFCAPYRPASAGAVRLNGDQPWNGLMPAGTLTPDLSIPVKRGSCEAGACCPLMDCPLVAWFELFDMVFGGCREAKTSGCGPCPTAIGHGGEARECLPSCKAVAAERCIERQLETPYSFHWKDASLRQIIDDLRATTGVNFVPDVCALHKANVDLDAPMSLSADNLKLKSVLSLLLGQAGLAYVVKDQSLQITTQVNVRCAAERAAECGMHIVRGPNGSQVIWVIREPQVTVTRGPEMVVPPFPPVPTPLVSRTASLPPPHFAPPPPPIMTPEGMVIPVPVAPPYGYPPQQYARPTLYDPAAELCEIAPPPLPVMPKHVQITQTARHVQLSSPNYSAQCERIRGGAHGELILEGNVRLVSRRHGQSMTINAQRVLLNVKDDQFVVEQADGMDQGRVNIAPVGCAVPVNGSDYLNKEPCYIVPQKLTSPVGLTPPCDGETRQWRGAGQGIPAAPIRVHGPIGY